MCVFVCVCVCVCIHICYMYIQVKSLDPDFDVVNRAIPYFARYPPPPCST